MNELASRARRRWRLFRTRPCAVNLLRYGDRVVRDDGEIATVVQVRPEAWDGWTFVEFRGDPVVRSYVSDSYLNVLRRDAPIALR